MTLDNQLTSMMASLPAPPQPVPADWDRFLSRAHRSLRVRRFATLALACTVVATAGLTYDTFTSRNSTQLPLGPASGGDEDGQPVEVWFVQDGKVTLTHQNSSAGITENQETGGTVDHVKQTEDALRRLFAGTPPELQAAGVTSAIPKGTELLGLELEPSGADAIAVVDVSREYLSTDNRELADAQIVFTATQLSGVEDVRILVEGTPIDMMGDDRGEFDKQLSPLIVGLMTDEGRREHFIFTPARMFGSVATDGGQLTYELVDESGNVIASGTVDIPAGLTEGGEKVDCEQKESCRFPYEEDITFTVTEETPGVLRVFVQKGNKRLYETTIPVVMAPRE